MRAQAILRLATLLVVLLSSHRAPAQDSETADTSDLRAWTCVELEYEFDKRWAFSIEEQLRLQDTSSEVDKFFTELRVRYKAPRGISFDAGYRWLRENDTQGAIQGYESARRYHVSGAYGHDVGRLSLSYRVRYQTKTDAGVASSAEADRHLRFRTRVRYNVRKWRLDPDFAIELYRALDDPGASDFDKVRFTFGTDWGSWGGSEIGVFYRVERDLGVDSPQTDHIVGLEFTYVFKRK